MVITKEIELKIESLLAQMTLEEKTGQLVQFSNGAELTGPEGEPVDIEQLVRDGLVGTVLNYTGVHDTKKLQDIAVKESRLGIPLMFGYDVIHGYKTCFPVPLAQAATWNVAAIEQAERIAAREAAAAGVNWAFTPMLDIARDPRWGRVIEGAGEDTFLGSQIAAARVRGLQGSDPAGPESVLACAKHYVGYGAAQAGRDYFTTDIPERSLREVYLPPFKVAVDAGVGSIMPAFNEIDGVPMTANRQLIEEVLIGEMGFTGCLVSDWTAVHELVNHGVANNDKDAAALALNACVDIDMCSGSYLKFLPELVSEGAVAEEKLDNSVRRVLRAKFVLNLFENPYKNTDFQVESRVIEAAEHFSYAHEMARECIVLLKNEGNILPLSGIKSIAVVGPLADRKVEVCGAWRAQADTAKATTVLAGIRGRAGNAIVVEYEEGCSLEDNGSEKLAAAVKLAEQSDVVVAVLGENADASGEAASLTDITFAGGQKELLRAVCASGKPVILLAQTGRPFAITDEVALTVAALQTWHLGSRHGNAVADVLFGDYNPSGKLPMTMPRSVGQVPIFYNCKRTGRPFESWNKYCSRYIDSPNTPLYPFGYGLSYTSFEYGEIRLDHGKLRAGDSIKLSVGLTNTGKYTGVETVQLYIQDKTAIITRPARELKAFVRVKLQPGESQTVCFEITAEMLEFVGPDMQWIAEPGLFTAWVGGSSDVEEGVEFELI